MRRLAIGVIWIALSTPVTALEQSVHAADVTSFGAACDGKADDTRMIRGAIATGRPVYFPSSNCRVTDILEFQNGQLIYGDGRTKSVIVVDRAFNMSALGVIRLGENETGATVRDIGISFEQPETASREEMVKYPPAIYARKASRFRIDRVRVSGGWVGLDASENTGGAFITDFENGSISAGMLFDHPRDFVHITNYHAWPFGFKDRIRLKVWSDGQTVAASFHKVDGLSVLGWNTYKSRTLISGSTFGTMTGLNLDDDYSRIEMTGGRMSIGQVWKSTSAPGDYFIRLTGGQLNLSTFHVLGGDKSAPLIEVSGTNPTSAILTIDNGIIVHGPADQPALSLTQGQLSASNIKITYNGNINRSAPFIKQVNGRLMITSSSWLDRGVGSGDAIEITTDDWHVIANNAFVGWTVKYPSKKNIGQYQAAPQRSP